MTTNKNFDIQRFWLLLKLEFHKGKKGFLMTFGIIYGLLVIGMLLGIIFGEGNTNDDHTNGYGFILLTGGFILSSLSLTDLSHGLRRYTYLTLPVSNLERFLTAWLLTTVGWTVAFTLSYVVFVSASHGLVLMLFKQTVFEPFQLFSSSVWFIVKTYFVLQGIFLVGAAHFKGYIIPKTLLTLVLFGVVCGVIGYLIMADLFPFDTECTTDNFDFTQLTAYKAWVAFQYGMNILLAPICMAITYYSIKEQEV